MLVTRSDSVNLDVLRTLAVLFVVVSHLPVSDYFNLFDYHLQALGLVGVLIFFVHTCLVLMLSIERQIRLEGRSNFVLIFFARRFFRIYPLSVVVVISMAVVYLYSFDVINYRQIISNLLLIQNITGDGSNPAALWSLPYEVQMYLILPALYFLVAFSKNYAPLCIGVAWLASAGFTLVLWRLGMNYHLVKYLPCFIPGVLAFSLYKSNASLKPWCLFVYVLLVALIFPVAVAMGAKENILAWPVCLGLGLLIPKCAEIKTAWLGRLGKVIAKYSFGIYLVHGPVIGLAFGYGRDLPGIVQWFVFFVSTVIFSYVAYHVVENPFIEFGKRLTRRFFSNSVMAPVSRLS